MKRIFSQIIVLIVLSATFSSHTVWAKAEVPISGTNVHSPNKKEPIRGIYVQAANTKAPIFSELLELVNKTDLNSMVIDIKDDFGQLTFTPAKHSKYYPISHPFIENPRELIQTLDRHHIYPIARIVVFKDTVLAKQHPDWSFKTAEGLWKNRYGDSFTNPFIKEVWDHNVGIAIEAAKLGFKEIQFDYVRFPEKFEQFENTLIYSKTTDPGKMENTQTYSNTTDPGKMRVAAVTEFVKYAMAKLKPYNVKLSVDTFGYTTVVAEAPGIGQNFSDIAKNVDVISAMIYPSHWSARFGIQKPDLQPYLLVKEYAKVENELLNKLKSPPISRPWLQDFTADWLGAGNYQVYGKAEIEAQISALNSEGIQEFLLWNSRNQYTPNVDYTPDIQ
jgi:hypothetical protein